MKEFYTYTYLRDKDGSFPKGTPRYVGKGQGNRAYRSCNGHRPPKDQSNILIQYWSDEVTALAYEKYLIDFWGRIDLGTGCLRNMTDGGEGSTGIIRSKESRRKQSLATSGVRKTPEHIKNQTARKLGRKRSSELRRKLSVIASCRTFTTQTRRNMRATALLNGAGARIRAVQQLANHTRWHIARSVESSKCALCQVVQR